MPTIEDIIDNLKPKRKQLLLVVRHAHRDTTDRKLDNGLSSKGKAQAKKIKEYIDQHFVVDRFSIFSSPKLRCIETVEPLGEPEAIDELDEMQRSETQADFENRVREFCRWWLTEGPEGLVICSHGDWIPVFLKLVSGEEASLKKGGLAEIRSDGKQLYLKYLIQEWQLD